MSGAIDFRTEQRVRRALVKAKFSLDDAMTMCVASAPDFFGDAIADPCPVCRNSGLRQQRRDRFWCASCHSSGDQVTWVMVVRSVSTARALDLIEDWMAAGGKAC